MHLVLIAHSQVRTFKNLEGGLRPVRAEVNPKSQRPAGKLDRLVLFAQYETFAKKDEATRREASTPERASCALNAGRPTMRRTASASPSPSRSAGGRLRPPATKAEADAITLAEWRIQRKPRTLGPDVEGRRRHHRKKAHRGTSLRSCKSTTNQHQAGRGRRFRELNMSGNRNNQRGTTERPGVGLCPRRQRGPDDRHPLRHLHSGRNSQRPHLPGHLRHRKSAGITIGRSRTWQLRGDVT